MALGDSVNRPYLQLVDGGGRVAPATVAGTIGCCRANTDPAVVSALRVPAAELCAIDVWFAQLDDKAVTLPDTAPPAIADAARRIATT